MEAIKTKDLTVGYETKIIAKDINLSLMEGELVCLLGQNGVGKSTLIKTLSNLLQPVLGSVHLKGQLMSSVGRKELAKQLGIVTTEKIGTTNMTVRELVALGRFPYTNWLGKESKEDAEHVESAITTCKIEYLKNSKLGEISDGQYQKVMIARVLAQDTQVILLDEPTAHLDIVNRMEIFTLLSKIKEESNRSILISTHELDLSVQFADKLWLMDFNSPVMEGSPKELIESGAIEKIFFHEEMKIDFSHLKYKDK